LNDLYSTNLFIIVTDSKSLYLWSAIVFISYQTCIF